MKENREGILVVISGFAGTGKGTLVKGLLSEYDDYALSVSMTTRKPRPGEEDGVSYFFVSREEFEKTIAQDGLVEYASYCDNYYGTPKAYVEEQLKAGKDVILEIEIQGALKIRRIYPSALLLFVMPPGAEELRNRLVGRGTETPEVIKQRMDRAAKEAEGIEEYDYIVVNDQIGACIRKTHEIIEAAHAKPFRNEKFIQTVREDLRRMSEE
ncbi:MAG: guanylate kinase [Lachnospiraceae bacterium]|nr:guanylate kinase [Lachnospiraceae bacterium]